MHHTSELPPHTKEPFYHRPPSRPLGATHLGESVTWQIDETQRAIDAEEIDRPRFPRGSASFRQAATIDQGVEQGRLADVGAPDEGDLWPNGGGVLLGGNSTADEFSRRDPHRPPPYGSRCQ